MLTPRELDVNLMGKNMLEGNEYMKGNIAQSKVADEEMTAEEMARVLTREMEKIALVSDSKQ